MSDFGPWYLAGLCFGGWLLHVITNIPMPELTTENRWQIVVSGLLVGFGTRLGMAVQVDTESVVLGGCLCAP